MFISSSVKSGLEFLSVNYSSIYENSELKVFRNITLLGQISNNWPKVYLEKMYTTLLNHVDNHCWLLLQ